VQPWLLREDEKRWWRCHRVREMQRWWRLSLLVRRRQWCDGDAVVAGEVRRCGGGCHGGGRREEN